MFTSERLLPFHYHTPSVEGQFGATFSTTGGRGTNLPFLPVPFQGRATRAEQRRRPFSPFFLTSLFISLSSFFLPARETPFRNFSRKEKNRERYGKKCHGRYQGRRKKRGRVNENHWLQVVNNDGVTRANVSRLGKKCQVRRNNVSHEKVAVNRSSGILTCRFKVVQLKFRLQTPCSRYVALWTLFLFWLSLLLQRFAAFIGCVCSIFESS